MQEDAEQDREAPSDINGASGGNVAQAYVEAATNVLIDLMHDPYMSPAVRARAAQILYPRPLKSERRKKKKQMDRRMEIVCVDGIGAPPPKTEIRPKAWDKGQTDLVSPHSESALMTFVEVVNDPCCSPTARASAANAIIERAKADEIEFEQVTIHFFDEVDQRA